MKEQQVQQVGERGIAHREHTRCAHEEQSRQRHNKAMVAALALEGAGVPIDERAEQLESLDSSGNVLGNRLDAGHQPGVEHLNESGGDRLVAVFLYRQQHLARIGRQKLDAAFRLASMHAHAPQPRDIDVGMFEADGVHHLVGRHVQFQMTAFRIIEDTSVMGREPLVDLERFEKSLQVPSGIVPTAGRSRKRRQIVPETAAQAVDGKPIQRRILRSDTERFRQTVVGLRPLGGDAQSPIEQRCRAKCRFGFHDCPLPFALPFFLRTKLCSQKDAPHFKRLGAR